MQYLFDSFTFDSQARELRSDGTPVPIEPKVFDLLGYLIENRHRMATRDELVEKIWSGRHISDAALSSAVSSARKALGDDGRAQKYIRTMHGHGFRFVAEECAALEEQGNKQVERSPTLSLHQEIQYLRSFDGTRIAFADSNRGETVVVKTANWMSHLEYDLESAIWHHWIDALSRGNRLIRYDERGNGLSDRNVDDISFEACVRDLECLVETLGLERINLFGVSQGAAVAVDFAVRHPELVDKIVIYGGFARGWRHSTDEKTIEQRIAMSMLMRTGWGQDSPEFRQLFTSRFMPDATPQDWAAFNELQRRSVSPQMAGNLHDMFGTIDVSHLLEKVSARTLVLHARKDAEISIGNGREIATGIPGARFVSLNSKNHILMSDEPAFETMVDQLHSFLAE